MYYRENWSDGDTLHDIRSNRLAMKRHMERCIEEQKYNRKGYLHLRIDIVEWPSI